MQSLFKRHAHLAIAVLTLCLLGGCSADSTGPTKASAQAKAEVEMDKWMSGQKSKTTTFKAQIGTFEPPISYKVRSVVPTGPYIPTDVLVEHPGLKQERAPAFQVAVDIDFRPQAQTSITKVVRYDLTWVEQLGDWTVSKHSRCGFRAVMLTIAENMHRDRQFWEAHQVANLAVLVLLRFKLKLAAGKMETAETCPRRMLQRLRQLGVLNRSDFHKATNLCVGSTGGRVQGSQGRSAVTISLGRLLAELFADMHVLPAGKSHGGF